MARVPSLAPLPLFEVQGSHEHVGSTLGAAWKARIVRAAKRASNSLWDDRGLNAARVGELFAPHLAVAQERVPHLVAELRARAVAAGVSFEIMSYLSAGGLPGQTAAGGCTSVGVKGPDGTFLVGHSEDMVDPVIDELVLLRQSVPEGDHGTASKFLSLCYVHTLPGCAAAVNDHGLAVLFDWLPDPEPGPGLTVDYVARALLDHATIDSALSFIESTPRHGGGNILLAQGERLVNIELTSKRMAVVDRSSLGVFAHTNHFMDPELATVAGAPQESSPPRLARAQRLARPGQTLEALQNLLSDAEGAPHSICRAETLAGFVADPVRKEVRVTWGEPAHSQWATHSL